MKKKGPNMRDFYKYLDKRGVGVSTEKNLSKYYSEYLLTIKKI